MAVDSRCIESPATRVLTNRALFQHIVSLQSGLPFVVVEYARRHEPHSPMAYVNGLLPCVAIDRGDFVMLQRLYRLYQEHFLASRKCPWPEVDSRIRFDRVMTHAAERRNFAALQWLHENTSVACDARAVVFAATLGHFDVVQWLADNRKDACAGVSFTLCDAMMLHGDLVLVRYMLQRFPGLVLTADAMDCAAARGHLELLEYLHQNRDEGCTTDAMDHAARCGRLEIVRFLHETRTEGCTTRAMDDAAANGHLDVVEFLHRHRTEGCTQSAMDEASTNGHTDVVEFLHRHRTEGCSTYAIDLAAGNGHLDVVRFLWTNRSEGCTPMAMARTARCGHLPVIQFLHQDQYKESNCCEDAVAEAARCGHLDVVGFLVDHCTKGCLVVAREHAAENHRDQIVEYLDRYIRIDMKHCSILHHRIDDVSRPCQAGTGQTLAAPAFS